MPNASFRQSEKHPKRQKTYGLLYVSLSFQNDCAGILWIPRVIVLHIRAIHVVLKAKETSYHFRGG